MDEQMIVSGDRFLRRKFAGSAWRAGIARNELIFSIICSAATAVAAVALVVSMSGKPTRTFELQCISCNYEFSEKSAGLPPIECPKCGGQAVWLTYRPCPECEKPVLVSRSRLTKQGQAKRDASSDEEMQGSTEPLPMEIQFWIKQADRTYKWSEWISMNLPHLLQQYGTRLQCTECGASLSSRARR